MSKALILTHKQWDDAFKKIKATNPPSVYLIRDRMRTVLGFTTREHEEWILDADQQLISAVKNELDILFTNTGKTLRRTIHLDFYDEAKKTMFLLKYM